MKRSIIVALLFLGLCLNGVAQQPAAEFTNENLSATAPYRVGEKLTYNISFSNFADAGHVELLVADAGQYFNRPGVVLRAHLQTSGVVSAALLSINQDYLSYINPANGQPYYTQQVIREGEISSRNVETEYNQPLGAVAVAPGPTGLLPGEFDFLAALYRCRAFPLENKGSYALTVRQGAKSYRATLRVLGRTNVKTNVGTLAAWETEITTNESSANSYRPRIYFTVDDRHVPVLIKLRHKAGEIVAQLAGSEFVPRPNKNAPGTPAPIVSDNDDSDDKPNVVLPRTVSVSAAGGNGRTLGNLPFTLGEQLNYNVYLTRIKEPVGTVTYEVKQRAPFVNKDALTLTVLAQTNAALQKIFTARHQITSIVDFNTLLPYRTDMNIQEGRDKTVQQLNWEQDRGQVMPVGGGPRVEIPVGTHDYVSLFYALRSFNLTPKKRTAVVLLINNRPRTLFIESLKRDTLELDGLQVPALNLALTLDDGTADRFVLRLWVSDDARRLPLRLTATLAKGVVRADLQIKPAR